MEAAEKKLKLEKEKTLKELQQQEEQKAKQVEDSTSDVKRELDLMRKRREEEQKAKKIQKNAEEQAHNLNAGGLSEEDKKALEVLKEKGKALKNIKKPVVDPEEETKK